MGNRAWRLPQHASQLEGEGERQIPHRALRRELRDEGGLARVLDTSLRYTVDKTTREILFLPLPAAIKYRAKPFVDVTMDRFAKAIGALTIYNVYRTGTLADQTGLVHAIIAVMLIATGLWAVVRTLKRRRILVAG